MKGDFTRLTHDPGKSFTRVLKQQGRVDLDADWNESVEILVHRDRTEALDVIGRTGVPVHKNGFRIERSGGSGDDDRTRLTISPGHIYVDGILCTNDAADPVDVTAQDDLPGYALPDDPDGVFMAYLDVWERHITTIEDPDIREIALGGPDTTTRTRTVAQVKLARLSGDMPLDGVECHAFDSVDTTGTLTARTGTADGPETPCVVPANAGYTGLENRLYRVEIHHDGRDADGNPDGPATFKWSRDNGSVVLPIADTDGIDGNVVRLKRLGHDEVLTVAGGDRVEIGGDRTDLWGRAGTLAQIEPGGIDPATLEISFDEIASPEDLETTHGGESHLKMRRWDHHATAEVALVDGALPIQADWFELEDGVQVRFDTTADYNVGDFWLIPARTRGGTILWPRAGGVFQPCPPLGIHHHFATLALLRRQGGFWTADRDCRSLFKPLTEQSGDCCCLRVEPGDDIQQAIDTVVAMGGGCITLCQGVHEVTGRLVIDNATDVRLTGENASTLLRLRRDDSSGRGGLLMSNVRRIDVEDLFIVSSEVEALIAVRHNADLDLNRRIGLRRLTLLNLMADDDTAVLPCAVKAGHTRGMTIRDCRLVAPAGILGLWGNLIPTFAQADPSGETPQARVLDFENQRVGDRFRVGDAFADNRVQLQVEALPGGRTGTYSRGECRVGGGLVRDRDAKYLELNQAVLNVQLDGPMASVGFRFASQGGRVHLRINGERLNAKDMAGLDRTTVGGVRIRVEAASAGLPTVDRLWRAAGEIVGGQFTAMGDANTIKSFAIGADALLVDDLTLTPETQASAAGLDLSWGDGLRDLCVRDCEIRYRDFGILAASARGWSLHGDRILPYDSLEALAEIYAAAASSALLARTLQDGLHAALAVAPETMAGSALLAWVWDDCGIAGCRIEGRRCIDVWWWFNGHVTGNRLMGVERCLGGFWLHGPRIVDNRFSVPAFGCDLCFVGGFRAQVAANRLRGGIGVTRLDADPVVKTLPFSMGALARAYRTGGTDADAYGDFELGAVMFYFALVEVADFTGTRSLLNHLRPLVGGYDPMIAVTLIFATRLLNPQWHFNVPVPVIDLCLDGNDIDAETACIDMDPFFTLGGLRVARNRLHTTTGRALRLNADVWTANPHFMIFLWRAGFGAISQTYLPVLAAAVAGNSTWPAAVRNALTAFVADLAILVDTWAQDAEAFLEADYRIADNSIRSLDTAIETNLWGISIDRNHITLQERAFGNDDGVAVVEALMGNELTATMAFAVRDGASGNLSRAIHGVNAAEVMNDPQTRGNVAKAIYDASSGVEDDRFNAAAVNFAGAVNDGNIGLAGEYYHDFYTALAALFDSYGIVVKAAGARITGNHVLVPQDIAADTVARGGIKIGSDGNAKSGDVHQAIAVWVAEMGLDPLLGVTETLVADNEIIGGYGHGVQVDAPMVINGLQLGFTNLKINANQIVHMAGGGIVIDEQTIAVGVEICDNTITACANQPVLAALVNDHGGIILENAALCRINGNRIRDCGAGQQSLDVFAIRLESVYGATLDGNYLLNNGSDAASISNGGMSLMDVYGDVSICHNEFMFQRGMGLSWNNIVSGNENPLPSALVNNVIFHVQGAAGLTGQAIPVIDVVEARTSRAAVQGNLLKAPGDVGVQGFGLFNLNQVSFSGNTCSTASQQYLGTITNIKEWLIFTQNTLTTNGSHTVIIKKPVSGILDNNVGNKPIDVQDGGLHIGTNLPPAV